VRYSNIIHQLMVPAPTLSYPIYIGKRLQDIYKDFFNKYPRVGLVTNDTLFNLYKIPILDLRADVPQVFYVIVNDGEKYKNIHVLTQIYKQFTSKKMDRDGLIAAFGGGVIGDLAGFASATYMRGVDYVQIPTTLLAMVDSSVGGKTAINLAEGKNMVGAFHQPQAVFSDLDFLDTLPVREFNAGIMEAMKYGLIMSRSFYDYICKNKENIKKRSKDTVAYIIHQSCRFKSEIVAQDEKEKGMRAILNFGHTIGHALESYTDYQFYLHGEAVALGTLAMVSYGVDRGLLDRKFLHEFFDILTFFQLPPSIPADFKIDRILAHLSYDKKKRRGKNEWVTLKQIGVSEWGQSIDYKQIEKVLGRLQKNG